MLTVLPHRFAAPHILAQRSGFFYLRARARRRERRAFYERRAGLSSAVFAGGALRRRHGFRRRAVRMAPSAALRGPPRAGCIDLELVE